MKKVTIVEDEVEVFAVALVEFDDTNGLLAQNGAAAGFAFVARGEGEKAYYA